MAIHEGTMFFQDSGQCRGWTWSSYIDANDHQEVLKELAIVAEEWVGFLPSSVRIPRLQSKLVGQRRNQRSEYEQSFVGARAGLTDSHWTGARIYWHHGEGPDSVSIIRTFGEGLYDRPQDRAKPMTLTDVGKGKLNVLLGVIIAGTWKTRFRAVPPTVDEHTIIGIVYDEPTNTYSVTIEATDPLITPGSKVFIYGDQAAKWPCLRGWRTVHDVDGPTLGIVSGQPCDQQVYGGGLKLYREVFEYLDIDGATIGPLSRRKVGVPDGIARGRRSRRRCECAV